MYTIIDGYYFPESWPLAEDTLVCAPAGYVPEQQPSKGLVLLPPMVLATLKSKIR